MSAVLTTEDIQGVADLLERLQNVQRAIRDLQEAEEPGLEFSCAITAHPRLGREGTVAHTHRLSFWVVLQGLAAMEREVRQKLAGMAITVQSVLPGVLRAAEEQAE